MILVFFPTLMFYDSMSGLGGDELTVGTDDLGDLFQT